MRKLSRRAVLMGAGVISFRVGGWSGAAAAADSLPLPFSGSTESSLPMMVAVAKGYAKDHDIDVTRFVASPGANIRANVIGKQFEFAALDWSHVSIARIAGAPLRTVLAITDRSNQSLLVRSTLRNSVKTPTDLKGKTVGVSSPGSSSWTYAKMALEHVGLHPDRDYNLIVIGGDTGVVTTALQTGRIDAVSAWEPITSIALSRNVAFPLIEAWNLKQQVQYYGAERLASLALITRDDVIKAKPDLVKRMVGTHVAALKFIRANSAEAIVDTVLSNPKSAEIFGGLGKTLFTTIVERAKPAFGEGCISKQGYELLMKRMVDYKVLPREIPFNDYADTSYVGMCA